MQEFKRIPTPGRRIEIVLEFWPHYPRHCSISPGDFEQALPKIKQWGRAGIIARVEAMEVAEETIKANVPTVILDPEPRLVAKVPELGSVEISQKPFV